MNNFQRFGPPFQYYNPYYKNNFYNAYRPPVPAKQHIPYESPQNSNNNNNCKNTNPPPSKNDDVWLDIFGIKLYFDDVLILSLLFFLYQEDVKDEWLFLSLVLLLIS